MTADIVGQAVAYAVAGALLGVTVVSPRWPLNVCRWYKAQLLRALEDFEDQFGPVVPAIVKPLLPLGLMLFYLIGLKLGIFP